MGFECSECGSKHVIVSTSEELIITVIYDENGEEISRKERGVDFFGIWGTCLDCKKEIKFDKEEE